MVISYHPVYPFYLPDPTFLLLVTHQKLAKLLRSLKFRQGRKELRLTINEVEVQAKGEVDFPRDL